VAVAREGIRDLVDLGNGSLSATEIHDFWPIFLFISVFDGPYSCFIPFQFFMVAN
jgi:hypothetical protein